MVSGSQHHRLRGGARPALDPPEQRVDPGHELTGAERLGEVVVGAHGQADDEVGLRIPGGQHQDGDGPVALDLPAHLEAVEAGEHEVEDDEIGTKGSALVDARWAIGGDGHREALAAQPGGDGVGDRRFVLHHEDGAREGGAAADM